MVDVLYRMAHPEERLADPLDQWEADAKFAIDASGSCEVLCQNCSTSYIMHESTSCAMLKVTRSLGKGESQLDPVWLAQCCVEVEDKGAGPPM